MEIIAIIVINTVVCAVLCLGILFVICVLTWHAPMDTTQPAENRLSKKELDAIVDDIIENERWLLSYAHCRPYMLTGSEQCKHVFDFDEA